MTIRTTLREAFGFFRGRSTPRRLQTLAGIAAAFVFIFATLLPAEVYQYTGVPYTNVGPGTTYTTSESLNGTFTLSDPLAANLTGSDFHSTATSWMVTDGVNTLSDSTVGSLTSLMFTTDGMGNITDWFFEATNVGSSVDVFSGGPGGINGDSAATGADSGSGGIGSWQDTSTPEPGTLGMMLAGSLLLLGTMRRRAKRAIA